MEQQRMVTLVEAFQKMWTTWNINGRASRSEFWWCWLAYFVALFVLGFIGGLIGMDTALATIFQLAAIAPYLCLTVRRLHDTGRSGWFALLGIVPLVNLVFLYLLTQPSEMKENKFGPVPNLLKSEFDW